MDNVVALRAAVHTDTLADFAETWFDQVSIGWRDTTQRRVDSILRCHVLPVLGERRLTAISTEDVAGLLNGMRHGGKSGGPKGRSKEKKSKGEVIDEWYQLSLVKKFNDEKDPSTDITVSYEVN